jgi:hypothetical protein
MIEFQVIVLLVLRYIEGSCGAYDQNDRPRCMYCMYLWVDYRIASQLLAKQWGFHRRGGRHIGGDASGDLCFHTE